MNATTADTGSDMLGAANELASWNRERTLDELRNFVNSRHALLPDSIDVE